MKKFLILFIAVFMLTGCIDELVELADEQIESQDIKTPDDNIEEEVGAIDYPETYNEETERYIIEVEYPQWQNLDTLNYQVEEIVFDEIDTFKETLGEWVDDEYIDLEDDMKSGLYIDYVIYHNDWEYLSLAYNVYIYYEGAAHGMSYTVPYNFRFEDWEEIELLDIFVDDGGSWLDAISYMSIENLKEQLYEDEFVDDGWIEEGAGPDSINFSAWNLTDDSIIFHFDPYQVAAYAAGPQQVEFKFSEIYGLLREPWASKGEESPLPINGL